MSNQPLNLYSVDPEIDMIGEWGRNCVSHIVAPNRTKAWQHFIAYWNGFGSEYEWTDKKSIRLLAKNVGLPEGNDEDFVWAKANNYPLVYQNPDGSWTDSDEEELSLIERIQSLRNNGL